MAYAPLSPLRIVIQSLKDVALNRNQLFPGKKPKDVIDSTLTIGILEGGTQSGQTVVAFGWEDAKTGKLHFTQLSANQFEGLMAAYKGACLRFEDERKQRDQN
jgi:hypothetical protein